MTTLPEQQRTEMARWLKMVEELCHAPDWPAGEQPIELKQTHISVVLLGQHRVLKLKKHLGRYPLFRLATRIQSQ
jgi:hypothetical protein